MAIKTTCISPRPFLLPLMYWPMYLSPFGHSNLVNSILFFLRMKRKTVIFSKFQPALSIHKVHENLPGVPAHIYAWAWCLDHPTACIVYIALALGISKITKVKAQILLNFDGNHPQLVGTGKKLTKDSGIKYFRQIFVQNVVLMVKKNMTGMTDWVEISHRHQSDPALQKTSKQFFFSAMLQILEVKWLSHTYMEDE